MELGKLFVEFTKLGHKMECKQIIRDGKVMTAIKFLDAAKGDIVPIVHIRSCENMFENGRDYKEIAEEISKKIREIDIPKSLSDRNDFSKCKPCLRLAVTGERLKEDVVYAPYLDLKLYVKCVLPETEFEVTNGHLQTWGITQRELLICATVNTEENVVVQDIEIFGIVEYKWKEFKLKRPNPVLGIFAGPKGYGASVIAMPHILAKIAEQTGGDFFIDAVDKDKLLITSCDFASVKDIEFVHHRAKGISGTVVSDRIYRYNKDTRVVTIES